MKKFLILAAASSTLLAACGGGAETSSNSVTANSNSNASRPAVQTANANHLAPGLSPGPITPSANLTRGVHVPGNGNVITNATPPGDPRAKTLKPGAAPPPGIDMETVRQMQTGRNGNVSIPPPGNTDPRPRKKVNRPVANTTQ